MTPNRTPRWTLPIANRILRCLEDAGYQRADDIYAFRALGGPHEAAHVYAGEAAPGLPGRPNRAWPSS